MIDEQAVDGGGEDQHRDEKGDRADDCRTDGEEQDATEFLPVAGAERHAGKGLAGEGGAVDKVGGEAQNAENQAVGGQPGGAEERAHVREHGERGDQEQGANHQVPAQGDDSS